MDVLFCMKQVPMVLTDVHIAIRTIAKDLLGRCGFEVGVVLG